MIWKKSRVLSKLSEPSAWTVCAINLWKYASALVRIALCIRIGWGIILAEKASVDSKTEQKPQKQKKSKAVPHIISRKQSAHANLYAKLSADFVRLNERKGSENEKRKGN